jgi:methylenetetrahydrofolate dehydrogenase (NADP+)/methenyltetrahydrofolate cyclohydrolase
MTSEVIDGVSCTQNLKAALAREVEQLHRRGIAVGVATVLVGDDYSANIYEQRLRRLAAEVGVEYVCRRLPRQARQSDVVAVIEGLNESEDVAGILVLRPLPPHIDEADVFRAILPDKDVESVHPENAGLLALGVPRFVPSTAAAVFHLLDTWIDSTGSERAEFYRRSHIVVVGRSNNVGKPCVSLAYDRQAAVESIDEWASKTGQLGRHTRRADVLIVAAGKPGLIAAEHVSEGAVVIDVGINPRVDADGRTHVVGDVDFGSVAPRARAITPVPGGVGPVTDVWLLHNVVTAVRAQRSAGVREAS